MKKNLFIFFATVAAAFFNSRILTAQNSSLSWSLAGNNNASGSHKLGTTNNISLRFYTNNVQRMIINSAAGYVGIGTTSPVNILTVKSSGGTPAASWLNGLNSPVFVGFGEAVSSEFLLGGASNTAGNRAVFQGRRSRGTLATPAAVANNDYITSFLASAYDGNTFQNPALVSFFVDGVPSAGNVPTRISLVTGSNAGNRVERLKVGSTGNFSFNNDQLFLQQSTGDVGIGTPAPESKLHVFNGSAGSVTGFSNAPLVIESSTNTYVNLLAPDASETGILFGKPANNICGEIVYNNAYTPNGLQFRTNGAATTMVLTNTGSLGIGTLSPEPYKTKISHGLKGLNLENASSLEDWELVVYGGNLQLYYNEDFRGHFEYSTGAYLYISDERVQTNIKPMNSMLEKIKQLKPSTYQFKNTADKHEYNGFIAQDVMKIFPAMVTHIVNKERNLDVYTMDYSRFGVIAVKGIQELQPIIEQQEEKIESLKETYTLKMATLEERILKLEAALANITANNNGTISNVVVNVSLEQNKPNPFNKNTITRYNIP